MEVTQWSADVKRQRRITTPGRTVVRATALEVRFEAEELARDPARPAAATCRR